MPVTIARPGAFPTEQGDAAILRADRLTATYIELPDGQYLPVSSLVTALTEMLDGQTVLDIRNMTGLDDEMCQAIDDIRKGVAQIPAP